MFKELVVKFLFSHPQLLDVVKHLLATKFITNHLLYKKYILAKAKALNHHNPVFKQTLYVETTLNCNSRCVFCYHHHKILTGTMTMDLFRKIIDDCVHFGITNVNLSAYGELTIDPFMFDRIKYLRQKNLTYGFITNGYRLTPKVTDQLFKLGGLTYVNFSVNGYSKKIYEKMMVGLNRNITYRHVLYFLQSKLKNHRSDLIVTVSTVKNNINQKDFPAFFKFWSNQKAVNQILPIELRRLMGDVEYQGDLGPLGPLNQPGTWLSPCQQIWGPLFVLFDGRVTPCCDDLDLRRLIVGDLNHQTLKQVFSGTKLTTLRQCHLCDQRSQHPICGKCLHNSIWF